MSSADSDGSPRDRAAAEGQAGADLNADQRSLTDVPAAWLRQLALELWPDAAGVAILGCTCKTLQQQLSDPALWRALLARRYGHAALPGLPPADETDRHRPVELDGWSFFPGVDGGQDGDTKLGADRSAAELAAAAARAGAEAFTTSGKVVANLRPQAQWRRFSFDPSEGMFVSAAAMAYRQLPQPEPPDDAPWPPPAPDGWVYFPSASSSGWFLQEGLPLGTPQHASLGELLDAATNDPAVVAVTTAGETKARLRPQGSWTVEPAWATGMYVKRAVVEAQGLVPGTPVPDYRALAGKLARLRVHAGQMTAAHLDDQHLSLQVRADSPGDHHLSLECASVWWLDISGTIQGVPPGDYAVQWMVDFASAQVHEPLQFEAIARPVAAGGGPQPAAAAAAQQAPPPEQPEQQQQPGQPQAGQQPEQQQQPAQQAGRLAVECTLDTVRVVKQRALQQGAAANPAARWTLLYVGTLHVPAFSAVEMKCWAHNAWKSQLRWAFAELVPRHASCSRSGEPGPAPAPAPAAGAAAEAASAAVGRAVAGLVRGLHGLLARLGPGGA